MIIIGIDPSLTSTGIVSVNEFGIILTSEAVKSKLFGVKRLSDIKEQMIPKVRYDADEGEETMVFIEGYSYGSLNNREILGELGGMIRLMLFEQEIPFIDVAPTSLKKFVTGKGNADKIAMALGIQKTWGKDFETTDQADAFALCQLGLAYMELIPDPPVFRQEVIAGMKAPKVKKKKVKK